MVQKLPSFFLIQRQRQFYGKYIRCDEMKYNNTQNQEVYHERERERERERESNLIRRETQPP